MRDITILSGDALAWLATWSLIAVAQGSCPSCCCVEMLAGKTVVLVAVAVVTLVVVIALMRYEFTIERETGGPELKGSALRWHVLATNATTCRNTIQGQLYITDERGESQEVSHRRLLLTFIAGFTCVRKDVDKGSGCCRVPSIQYLIEITANILNTLSSFLSHLTIR